MPVYWNRGAVGVKVTSDEGKDRQLFYFSDNFDTVAVNIFLSSKMCERLVANGKDWATTEDAKHFETKLKATAAAALEKFKEEISSWVAIEMP